MKYLKKRVAVCIMLCLSIILSACHQEVVEGPVEEALAAVTLNDLEAGHFYVKSGDSYYLLPLEDSNFELNKEIVSTDESQNGMTDTENCRLIDFVYKDMAIPTLYKNDLLIYVSDGDISSFTWERFKDYGYSIGLSGLEYTDAEKISSGEKSIASRGSTIESVISSIVIPENTRITVDKINGTTLTSQYLNDGGIVTGMSKDATANIDFYIGTQHTPVTATADTKYFKSFELYNTGKYSLSTDGYAIVEIPSYFKSGYYMVNNAGFLKFLNIDRGVDESGIDLEIPYYYTGDDGKTLTFYEWQNDNGITQKNTQVMANTELNVNNYPERCRIVVDNSQKSLGVTVAYQYVNDEYQEEADKNGKFPHVWLLGPIGEAIPLTIDESHTYSSENTDHYTYLNTVVEGPVAGEWYILYENFEFANKVVGVDISSGNATSYLHNSKDGSITIYYDASSEESDFTITWEETDRAAAVKITAPDGTIYSKEETPERLLLDEYGKITFHVPNLQNGEYKFDITGDKLGRVWVDCNAAVSETPQPPEEPEAADKITESVSVD